MTKQAPHSNTRCEQQRYCVLQQCMHTTAVSTQQPASKHAAHRTSLGSCWCTYLENPCSEWCDLLLQFKFDGILHNASQEDVFEVRAAAAAAATAALGAASWDNSRHAQAAVPVPQTARNSTSKRSSAELMESAQPRQTGSCCLQNKAACWTTVGPGHAGSCGAAALAATANFNSRTLLFCACAVPVCRCALLTCCHLPSKATTAPSCATGRQVRRSSAALCGRAQEAVQQCFSK